MLTGAACAPTFAGAIADRVVNEVTAPVPVPPPGGGGEVLTHKFDDIAGSGVDADATTITTQSAFNI